MKSFLYSQKFYYLLSLLSAILFLALWYLLWDANDLLLNTNEDVFQYLTGTTSAQNPSLWKSITLLGGPLFVSVVTVISGIYFWLRRDRKDAFLYAASMLGGLLFVLVIKQVSGFDRPEYIYATETSFSFPSGHTTLSTIFLILTGYVYMKNKKHHHRLIVLAVVVCVSILIAVSRLMLGEHWLTDILGGYLLAVVWSTTMITFFGSPHRLWIAKK